MSFSLVLFFLIITPINILLGLYVAVQLGYGPPRMRDIPPLLPKLDFIADVLSSIRFNFEFKQSPKPVREAEEEVESETISEEKESSDNTEMMEQMLNSLAATDLNDLLDDESDEIAQVSPLEELFDDDLASLLMSKGTEAWLANEKYVETSILKLNSVMMKSGKRAAELDAQLRGLRGRADEASVKAGLRQLKEDCENYLEGQAEVTEEIRKRVDEFGELTYLADDIEMANMEQASAIETTISNLDHMDFTSDPESGLNRLLAELGHLRIARHRLRDQQERAFLTVTRYEDRFDTINEQLFNDEMTGQRNRIGVETVLWNWWQQNRHQERQLAFALLDIAKCGELNDEYGILVCDKLLRYIGLHIEKQLSAQDMVGVLYGNCYLVATVNVGLRKTTTAIEKIRQDLERMSFNHDGDVIKTSVTCAVTEALPKHEDTDVYEILKKTMDAAKSAGRNHTFLWDPSTLNPEPELVESPNLGSEYVTVDLKEAFQEDEVPAEA
jgi:diguanylate cyclase (GGDEF)-like protein